MGITYLQIAGIFFTKQLSIGYQKYFLTHKLRVSQGLSFTKYVHVLRSQNSFGRTVLIDKILSPAFFRVPGLLKHPKESLFSKEKLVPIKRTNMIPRKMDTNFLDANSKYVRLYRARNNEN